MQGHTEMMSNTTPVVVYLNNLIEEKLKITYNKNEKNN